MILSRSEESVLTDVEELNVRRGIAVLFIFLGFLMNYLQCIGVL